VAAKNACRATGRNGPLECRRHGRRLARAWNNADQHAPRHHGGTRQSDGFLRHGIDVRETSIIDLLPPGHRIKFHHLDLQRVREVGDSGVIKRNMSVFTNAHADQVNWRSLQQGRIARALRRWIGTVAANRVKNRRPDAGQQPLPLVIAHRSRVSGRQPDIFVQMKNRHPVPVDSVRGGKSGKQFVL